MKKTAEQSVCTREQSNKRSGTRLITESETGESPCEARPLRARKTLTPRFTDFFTDFEKKTDRFAVCWWRLVLSSRNNWQKNLLTLAVRSALPSILSPVFAPEKNKTKQQKKNLVLARVKVHLKFFSHLSYLTWEPVPEAKDLVVTLEKQTANTIVHQFCLRRCQGDWSV